MEINKLVAKYNVEILNKLFLVGDILYATPSFHVMDGQFDYAHKVFDSDKNYLGMIRESKFPNNCVERYEEKEL